MSNLNNLPKSPVTLGGNVKVVETFAAAEIAALYLRQENLDIKNYFAHGDTVYLLECEDTGYRFYYPFEIIGDQAFYESFQVESDKKGDGYDREWAGDHKFAAGQIGKDAKLLEIGCGSGKFLSQISDITPNVAGLELNSIAADAARRKGLDVQVEFIEDFCEEESGCRL